MSSKTRFWRKSVAPVAAALIGLGASNAQALSLGKVKVQSALGQSLQAEIDISDLSEDDAKSIKSVLASPAAFAGMGLEYNPALNGTQIALLRRPNGSRFLKLASTRPLNDPFIDLVVELSWASGRIVRTYTILLDPPKAQDAATTALLPTPSGEAASSQPLAVPAPGTAVPASVAASNPAPSAVPVPVANKAAVSTPQSSNSSQPSAATERKRVRVGKGDTAGKLARSMVPEGVTVEQMLVAMLGNNPKAFVGGNVNRLRAGVELSVPDAAAALKTSQADARQMLEVQYQAFQSIRRSLADQAPTVSVPATAQEAVGSLAKPAATPGPKGVPSDTLKLSKDSVQSKADKESMEQIAKQRAKNEASERAAELAKNIEELNQLAKVAAKPLETANPTAAATPASESTISASPTSTPAASSAAALPAPPIKPAEPEPSAPDLIDSALQNPGILAAMFAVLGLGGYGLLRRVRGTRSPSDVARKEGVSHWETNANTNFDTVGGQRIDTADASTVGLVTTVYPDSQLDMVNELDPVAEAEVYLAYGKDVPAEEILKEGLQQDPTRVAIHLKLLGIFAKRGDLKSFESMAREVAQIVDATSSEWAQLQEMGKSIDPSNPLYGHPAKEPQDSEFEQSLFNLDLPSNNALPATSVAPAVAVAIKPKGDMPATSDLVGKATSQTYAAADFDLASITLDPSTEDRSKPPAGGDRMDATLALAEQFMAIDEKDGARALLQEVIAEGNDALRQRAKALLTQLK